MQLGSLRRQLALLFVLLILVQSIVLTLLYSRMKHLGKLHTELLQIDDVRTELYALRAAALDAETGQRGFVITGREELLQPYRAAVVTFPARLGRLRALVADQPALKSRTEALAAQIHLAQTDMARLVELRRRDGFEAAQQKMLDGAPREAMDMLRTLTLEIDEEEQHHEQTLEQSYLHARSTALSLTLFGLGIGFVVTAGLGIFILVRLGNLTVVLGKPLLNLSRGLRAEAKAMVLDASVLAQFAKTDVDAKAEGQATLDVISRMAKDLSTVAMEITSSVRVVADSAESKQQEQYSAQLECIIALSGRIAQSALSLELTTAEQRRVFDGSGASFVQLEQSVKSVGQAAARIRKISKDLVSLLQIFPELVGKPSPASSADGSQFEISPVRI